VRRITEPPNLTAIIQSRRLSTFGHIARVDDDADDNDNDNEREFIQRVVINKSRTR